MDLFDINLIRTNVNVPDKDTLLDMMAENLFQYGYITDKAEYLGLIKDREMAVSTGIGYGIGIPHVRHQSVKELKIALYILENEIDFDSIDGKPVNIVFMVTIPSDGNNAYMQVLKMISSALHSEQNRQFLINSNNPKQVLNFLERLQNEL